MATQAVSGPPPAREVPPRPTRPGLLGSLAQFWESVRITFFVIGTALIIFAAARNTVTWHAQKFWGASGDFWQRQWGKVYDLSEGHERLLAFLGSMFVGDAVFIFFNALLMIVDVTGHPKFLLKYKIQEDKNVPIDKKKLKNAILQVIFNQTIVALPFFYFMLIIMEWRGVVITRELPTFTWVLFELVVFVLVEEVFFYYSHRLLHHPRIYKYIHKKHHEWTAPIGIIALYAHPVEHIMSNLLPPVMGPLLMGSHLATAWLWFSIALMSTTISHSGYHFPGLPSPEAHDFHHLKFNTMYGVLGVLDRLHGTDKLFHESKAYQRHFLLLSLVPVSQQFPNDPKSPKKSE